MAELPKLTGREFEDMVFGRCQNPSSKIASYKESMIMARKNQPPGWDALDPPTKMARSLLNAVKNKLSESWERDSGKSIWLINKQIKKAMRIPRTRIFSSLDTPLDRFHHTDGWIEWHGQVMRIDLTVNRRKKLAGTLTENLIIISPEDLVEPKLQDTARIIAGFLYKSHRRPQRR